MKEIDSRDIILPIAQKIDYALTHVDEGVVNKLRKAANAETSPLCRWALNQIVRNDEIAAERGAYACQDCGQAMLFVQVGQDVHIKGNLTDALNEAVKKGYCGARKSVADPINRLNTTTNTPAIIYYDITEGCNLTVNFMAKGAGSENMGKTYMLTPSKGTDGIVASVLNCVKSAGSSPCPPIILGIGIGGTMDKCAVLSKKALVYESKPEREDEKQLLKRILTEVNASGIGAQGLGGDVTALDAYMLTAPTHIGMLPVAVTIQCHSDRKFAIVF